MAVFVGTNVRNIINGTNAADSIAGLGGNDDLLGLGGNDEISGGTGNDLIKGGIGNDELFGDENNDTLISGEREPFGTSSTSFTVPNGGNDILDGGSGNDRLIATFDSRNVRVIGGSGTDTLQMGFDNDALQDFLDLFPPFLHTDPSTFTATIDLAAGTGGYRFNGTTIAVDLTISGVENIDGSAFSETLFGNSNANVINGGGGDDTIDGRGGNDTLNGGDGNDTLSGGDGNDTFLSSSGDDDYIGGPGIDTVDFSGETTRAVRSSGQVTVNGVLTQNSLFLSDNSRIDLFGIERIVATKFNDSFASTGNAIDNSILEGREGNDSYFVRNSAVLVVEGVGGGNDTVFASVDYTLPAGQEIETLATSTNLTTPLILTGNEFANTISGNAGANILNGEAGDDILNGGAGGDFLRGSGGNDTYVFSGLNPGIDAFEDTSGDDTVEFDFNTIQSIARIGNNLVADLTNGDFTVIDHFNGFAIERAKDLSTGNVVTLAVGLVGGDASGIISGTDNGETLDGRGGNDFLYGNDGKDTLLGGDGNDLLNGGRGKDELVGGNGDDTLIGGKSDDKFVFAPGSGRDIVRDFEKGDDRIDLTAFDTSFRKLDDDRDGRLEDGEGDRHITVDIRHGDTILKFAGGSITIENVKGLGEHDFLF